ncbi:MAG: SUMF1/EgtB/PvdO family nonheme iron enzyme, partial [Bacteroidales bacterium]|nr:SUMF1/EgtB/PvdO family nonheme iron enzyme [Bacteroidales bacterium]
MENAFYICECKNVNSKILADNFISNSHSVCFSNVRNDKGVRMREHIINGNKILYALIAGLFMFLISGCGSSVEAQQTTMPITIDGKEYGKMIFVQGGTFQMGATSEQGDDAFDWEKPVHSVTLSDYYIGETEVTQGLWKAVMGNNPSNFAKGDNYPVDSVSWYDVQDFLKKLNAKTGRTFCLPTEAQWEFAARGGNKSQRFKYNGSNNIDDFAWYNGNSNSQTHAVKQKLPNELGIYDMSGNVWEWCQDWYGQYSNVAVTNPQGASSGSSRVLRGGSWY